MRLGARVGRGQTAEPRNIRGKFKHAPIVDLVNMRLSDRIDGLARVRGFPI